MALKCKREFLTTERHGISTIPWLTQMRTSQVTSIQSTLLSLWWPLITLESFLSLTTDPNLPQLLRPEKFSSCKTEESLLMMDTEWARSSMKKTNSETESECQLLTTSTLITKTTKRCKKLFKLNKINHCNTSSISTNHTKLLHTVLIYPAKLLIPELPMPLSSTPPH